MQMFNWDKVAIRYQPFTVFYLRDFVQPDFYRRLADDFPDCSRFRYRDTLGNKYLLTEAEGPAYYDFVKSNPQWQEFHDQIKSDGFREQVLSFLRLHPDAERKDEFVAQSLTSRFEFSVLPACGGSQRPHTDSPHKAVTLVLSLMKEGEWNPGWGGGTSLCLPKEESLYSNYSNRYLEFDDVRVIDTLPFVPNGCAIFVKSAVSWHCVTPINVANGPMRKTVAISLFNEDAN